MRKNAVSNSNFNLASHKKVAQANSQIDPYHIKRTDAKKCSEHPIPEEKSSKNKVLNRSIPFQRNRCKKMLSSDNVPITEYHLTIPPQ